MIAGKLAFVIACCVVNVACTLWILHLHSALKRENARLRALTPDALGTEDREVLGQIVRRVWVAWAKEQPNPKPSWLAPWEELTEPEREVDRRIGAAIAAFARGEAEGEVAFLRDTIGAAALS